MLTEYVDKAMSKAEYEKLEDGTYCGKIPPCLGTIAFGRTLYECQHELKSVLEGWLIVKMRHGDPFPVIDDLDLKKGGKEDGLLLRKGSVVFVSPTLQQLHTPCSAICQ